jgi:hypothetical protein
MRRTPGPLLLVPIVALSALLLHGCGDSAADTTSDGGPSSSQPSPTAADCAALLPDDAVDTLGWSWTGEAAVDLGRCTREADQGTLSAMLRPVPGVDSDDLPAAAEKEYDERCAQLATNGTEAEDVDWLGSSTPGCAVLGEQDATGQTSGVSTLVAHDAAGHLAEVSVAADQPTQGALVQETLTALAQGVLGARG